MRFSLARSKKGEKIIKIHHDFGEFNFYLMPTPKGTDGLFAWTSDPKIKDENLGRMIAMHAAKAIAKFSKQNPETMSFEDMKEALTNAEKIGE